MKLCCIFHKVG